MHIWNFPRALVFFFLKKETLLIDAGNWQHLSALICGDTCSAFLELSPRGESLLLSSDRFSVFMMEKQMLLSAAVGCFRALLLLILVCCSPPLVSPSDALHNLSALTYPYSSILSPLLKALSEHGGSRWSLDVRKKMKPEHRYVKYLTEVYKKSTRMQRSVDGGEVYNTIRLIKPQDECPAQSNKGEQRCVDSRFQFRA